MVQNKVIHYESVVYMCWLIICIYIYIYPSANMERAGFMTTAPGHQGVIKRLWLHFWGPLMSSIFILKLMYEGDICVFGGKMSWQLSYELPMKLGTDICCQEKLWELNFSSSSFIIKSKCVQYCLTCALKLVLISKLQHVNTLNLDGEHAKHKATPAKHHYVC